MLFSIETAATACVLALVGGVGSYLQGCRDKRIERGFFSASTEISLALTAGLAMMYLGLWREFHPAMTNFLILILTNNGGDSISKLKGMLLTFVTAKLK